jgi:acyl-CoA thioester hydrolase
MLADHEIEIRVRYYETDRQGHVHHANYFKYFELGRTEQLLAAGHSMESIERQDRTFVVKEISCHYYRPCTFGDTLRLRTITVEARGARVVHRYELFRNGELLAEGHSTLAMVDHQGRVRRLPEWLKQTRHGEPGKSRTGHTDDHERRWNRSD